MKETKTTTATKPQTTDLFTMPEEPTTAIETIPQRADREEREERQALVRMQSLMAKAGGDPAAIKRELENRYLILTSPREAVISGSKPSDWVLFAVKDSEPIGYPRDSLLVQAKKFFGINIYNYRPKVADGAEPLLVPLEGEFIKQDGDSFQVYTATMWADADCGLTGEVIPENRFTARTGRFAGTAGNQDDLRAACRTGLDAMIVRKLTGLRKVPEAVLIKLGVDTSKCSKGSGFGSSSERGAAKVAEQGVPEKAKALWDECLKRVGGDANDCRDLFVDITSWTKDGKLNKGFDSPTRLTKDFQIDAAWKRLRAHAIFGDNKERQPGSDD